MESNRGPRQTAGCSPSTFKIKQGYYFKKEKEKEKDSCCTQINLKFSANASDIEIKKK